MNQTLYCKDEAHVSPTQTKPLIKQQLKEHYVQSIIRDNKA